MHTLKKYIAHVLVVAILATTLAAGLSNIYKDLPGVQADTFTFTDSFTATTYRDTNNSSVDWENTGQVELLKEVWRTTNDATIGTENLTNNSTDDTTFRSVSVDGLNRMHVTWIYHDPDTFLYDVYYAYQDGTGWKGLGSNGFNVTNNGSIQERPSIATDVAGNPHIVYMQDNTIYHIYWDGANWSTLGDGIVSDGGTNQYPKLVLDSNDRPHVSWQNGGNPQYGYWNGSDWVYLQGSPTVVDLAGNNGFDVVLDLDSDNNPHIAWSDDANTGNRKIHHVYWDPTAGGGVGGWVSLGATTEVTAGGQDQFPSIVVDSTNRPHIAYTLSASAGGIGYMFWNGAEWDTLGGSEFITASGSGNGGDPELRLQPGVDLPLIIFQANGKAVLMYWNLTQWVALDGYDNDGYISNPGVQVAWPSFDLTDDGMTIFAAWTQGTVGSAASEVYVSKWTPDTYVGLGYATSETVDTVAENILSATVLPNSTNITSSGDSGTTLSLGTTLGEAAIADLGNNRFVIAYGDSATSEGKVQVCDTASYLNGLSCGTPVTFSQPGEVASVFAVDELDDTHVALTYVNNNGNDAYAWVGTISGGTGAGTITFDSGERVQLFEDGQGDNQPTIGLGIEAVSATRFLVHDHEVFYVFDVSAGDTITQYASYDAGSTVACCGGRSSASWLDADHIVVAYTGNGGNNSHILHLAAGAITASPAFSFTGGDYFVDVAALSSDTFILVTSRDPAFGTGSSALVGRATIDDTTPANTTIAFSNITSIPVSGANAPLVKALSPFSFVVVSQAASNDQAQNTAALLGTISYASLGIEIQFTGGPNLNAGLNYNPSALYIPNDFEVMVNGGTETILRFDNYSGGTGEKTLQLFNFERGQLEYYLSNNGTGDTCGTGDWHLAVPGSLVTFTTTGSDLRWCSIFSIDRAVNYISPRLDEISIEYNTPVTIAPTVAIKTDNTYATDATAVDLNTGTVYAEITYAAGDISGSADSFTAYARNVTNGDLESFTVTETGGSTGIFRGSVASGYAASNTSGNGTLEGASGSSTVHVFFEISGTGAVIDDFEGYADTAALQAAGFGVIWGNNGAGAESAPIELIAGDATNATRFIQKFVDADGGTPTNTTTTLATSMSDVDTTINVSDGSAFPTSDITLRIEDEIITCSSRSGGTFSSCTRLSNTRTAHTIGSTVILHDDNPYGLTTIAGVDGPRDMTNKAIKFDLWIDDVSKLDATGNGFGWLPTGVNVPGVTLLLTSGSSPGTYFIPLTSLRSSTWQTFSIPAAEFASLPDITSVSTFYLFVATGDGSVGGGVDATIKFDNFEISNTLYYDAVSATATAPSNVEAYTASDYATLTTDFTPGNTIYLQYAAATGEPLYRVQVRNSTTGDAEVVTLIENGSTGNYRGSIATSSGAANSGNGTLTGSAGDSISLHLLTLDDAVAGTYANASTFGAPFSGCCGSNTVGNSTDNGTSYIQGHKRFIVDPVGDNNQRGLPLYFLQPGGTANDMSLDLSSGGFSFDIRLDDPNAITNTPNDFGGALSPAIQNITVAVGTSDGGSPTGVSSFEISPASLTANTWQTIHVQASDFSTYLVGPATFTNIDFIYIFFSTYTGGTGNALQIDVDNFQYGASAAGTLSFVAGNSVQITNASFSPITAINPGSTLYFESIDASASGAGTLPILVSSAQGDKETVVLTETGSNTGIFRGSITTNSATAVNGDEVLQVGSSSSITAKRLVVLDDFETYTDTGAAAAAWFTFAPDTSNTPTLEGDKTQYLKKTVPSTNPYGANQIHTLSSAVDLTGKDIVVDVYVNDPSYIDYTTGNDMGHLPQAVTGFAVGFVSDAGGTNGTNAYVFDQNGLSVAAWQTFVVAQADIPINPYGFPAADWSNIGLISLAAITGNGTTSTIPGGQTLDVRIDNFAYVDAATTDSITIGDGSALEEGLHFTNSSYVPIEEITMGQTLYLRLNQAANAGDGTIGVQIISAAGDTETITLTETGPSTGRFQGSIVTASSTSPTTENGTLEAANSNAITGAVIIPGGAGSETVIEDFESYTDATDLNDFSDGDGWNQPAGTRYTTLETDNTKYLQKTVFGNETGTLFGALAENIDATDLNTISSTLTADFLDDGSPISVTDVSAFIVPGYFVVSDGGSTSLNVRCDTKDTLNNQLTSCSFGAAGTVATGGTVTQDNVIQLTDMTNFLNDGTDYYKIDNEWFLCTTTSYNPGPNDGWLSTCLRAQRGTTIESHTAGANVIIDDSNKYGFAGFPIGIIFSGGYLDFGTGDFSFDIRLSNPNNVDATTGSGFEFLPVNMKNITVLLTAGMQGVDCAGSSPTEPCEASLYEIPASTLTANVWETITIAQSDFVQALAPTFPAVTSWDKIRLVIPTVATGDGTTGNDMVISIDNLKAVEGPGAPSFGASDAITALATSTTTGGGGGLNIAQPIVTSTDTTTTGTSGCNLPNAVTSLQAMVVSQIDRDIVDLTWALPSTNRPSSMRVYRREGIHTTFNETLWTQLPITANLSNGTATFYADTTPSLFADRSYSYAVVSVNSCGQRLSEIVSVTLPKRVPLGTTFDATFNITVKTKSIRDDRFTDGLKQLIEEAKQEARAEADLSASASSKQVAQTGSFTTTTSTTTTLITTTCSGATDLLRQTSPKELLADQLSVEQGYRTHLDSLIRKEFFCRVEQSGQKVDLTVFHEAVFFLRESAFKFLVERHPNLVRSLPDWPTVDRTVVEYFKADNDRIGQVITKAAQSYLDQQTARTSLSESGLLSLDLTTVKTFEDIAAREDIREVVSSIPEIGTLLKGHQETFTFEIWPAGLRREPLKRIEVTTDVFGQATIVLPNFQAGTYDFSISKPYVIRKYLSSMQADRLTMYLDFTRGLARERGAYLRFGDLNNDSCIDAKDLQEAFKVTRGENKNISIQTLDSLVGNEDGVITLSDFVPILQGWGCSNGG